MLESILIEGINWLASYPKSGNTWVRAFLAAYMADGVPDLNNLNVIGPADSNMYVYRGVCPRDLAAMSVAEVGLYRPAVLYNMMHTWEWAGRDFDPVVKTHAANTVICGMPTVPAVLSRGAVIVVRDPRDVAVSSARWFEQSYDDAIVRMAEPGTIIGADSVRQPLKDWSSHIRSWQDAPCPYMMYRYEDLLADPHGEFSEMLEFLGWEVDEAKVNRAVESCDFSNLKQMESEHGMKENRSSTAFFHSGHHGKYADVLTEEQIKKIEEDHGELMAELGYL